MANEQNLKSFKDMCREDAAKIQSKGGKARAQKIKERKTLAELMKIALSLPNEETGETNEIAITNAMINKAIKGDVSAYQTIRDTIGEKPTDKQEITGDVNVLPTTFNILPVRGSDEL